MKHLNYELTVRVENVGRIDGTVRDTWEATANLSAPASPGKGSGGRGAGKAPEVAIRRAVDESFGACARRERTALVEVLS